MSNTSYCDSHRVIQHRDGKPPWCENCGLTKYGEKPTSVFQNIQPIQPPEKNVDPQTRARQEIVKLFNGLLDGSVDVEKTITIDDTFVVWYAYILGNFKCLISTTVPDQMYYEVTYDVNRGYMYIDSYKKFRNTSVKYD